MKRMVVYSKVLEILNFDPDVDDRVSLSISHHVFLSASLFRLAVNLVVGML